MTADTAYKIVLYAAAKNLQDGYVSPEDFNTVLMPTAQHQYLDFLLGEYQKYQPTRPFSPVAFSNNQRNRTSLAPLIYNIVMPINSASGVATYPDDFLQVDAMWGHYNLYKIRFTQQDSLWSKYHSVIDPVDSNPLYYMNNDGFNFLPATLGFARMSYVRTPPSIVWGYVNDSNGVPVYNPATSQDPIWADSDMHQVIIRALALIGVNLQAGVVSQYAEIIKNQGQ